MSFLKTQKHNWALRTGIVIKAIPVFILLVWAFCFSEQFLEYVEIENEYYFGSKLSFIIENVFFMILVGPIYEELIMDGAFLKNKFLKILSYVGLIGVVLYFNFSIYSGMLLLLFYILSYIYHKKGNGENIQNLRILTNAVLFSVIHLNLYGDLDYTTLISFLSRCGGHLIALWLVLNYKLIHAIIFHAIWNGLLAIGVLFTTDFSPQPGELHVIENDSLKIEYQEAADFNEKLTILGDPYHWKFETVSFEDIYFWFPDKEVLENKYEPTHDVRYNIDIILKDSSLKYQRQAIQKQFINLMLQDSLLRRK